jgi:c-di-GMP-binding flagellar brake protein YcgR
MVGQDDMEERRKHSRLPFRIPMRYRRIETQLKEFKGSLMKDISVGGAKMTIFEFLPLNLKLATEIPLFSGLRPVRGSGRVAWVNKIAYGDQYEVGIEFTSVDEEDLTQILEFITSQKTQKRR